MTRPQVAVQQCHIVTSKTLQNLSSSCSRGDGCPFRHEPAALTNETVATTYPLLLHICLLPFHQLLLPSIHDVSCLLSCNVCPCLSSPQFPLLLALPSLIPVAPLATLAPLPLLLLTRSTQVCTYWKAGNCSKPHCIFRHLEDKKNRKR